MRRLAYYQSDYVPGIGPPCVGVAGDQTIHAPSRVGQKKICIPGKARRKLF
jgi:hypothetical protein